ncbi:uncharacterized protein LOC119185884 isoform X4 [Rhipicephalus microplus]|uniref:uncharacterized protein LOC119185884 isoform X4 n=1 Tax=Rhipicephalus microplus TaxID=6941 RepID=UPI003F6D96D5
MSRSLAAIRFFLLAQDSVWWRLGFFVPFVSEGPQVTLKVHPLHRCLSLLCGLAVDRDHGAPTPCCRCLRSATRASSRTSSCLMWCGGSEGQPPTSLL